MGKGTSGSAVRQISTLLNVGTTADLTDVQLLDRYVIRDGPEAELAFATLVERHGAIVLRTCRARIGDEHAAQDAFQATFLVLACRAGSLRVQGSLGPWLHSVAWRVASSARSDETRRRWHERRAAELGDRTVDAVHPDDWEPVFHEEIDRLADRFRKPVVLCGLAGLTTAQAARRLGWPVGTVRSRLARGRERLRDRLTRRGLVPSVGVAGVFAATEGTRAAGPAAVAVATVRAVVGGMAGRVVPGVVPATVASMAKTTIWGMMLKKGLWTAAMLTMGVSMAATAIVVARVDDNRAQALPSQGPESRKPPTSTDGLHAVAPAPKPLPANSLAAQFGAIKAEYDANNRALSLWATNEKTKPAGEQIPPIAPMIPDQVAYCRRMIDLAATAPKDPAAREALLWVIDHPGRSDHGPFGEEFARAAARLVRDHGDDPEAVRIGLQLDNVFTVHRDQLLAGFVASAKGHESKGLARLALGKYLQRKSHIARFVRKSKGRRTYVLTGVIGEDGKPYDAKQVQSDEEYAYDLLLRQCDPDILRAEAERLFEEVIRDYGDIPCITFKTRKLEALLRQPKPEWNGNAITEEQLQKLRRKVASPPTLAKIAEGHLDEMRNLVVGKPAPEIDGVDFDGKPLRLSDYRGRVVALSFWGSWLVRPLHASRASGTRSGREISRTAVRNAERGLQRTQGDRRQGDEGRANELAQLAR